MAEPLRPAAAVAADTCRPRQFLHLRWMGSEVCLSLSATAERPEQLGASHRSVIFARRPAGVPVPVVPGGMVVLEVELLPGKVDTDHMAAAAVVVESMVTVETVALPAEVVAEQKTVPEVAEKMECLQQHRKAEQDIPRILPVLQVDRGKTLRKMYWMNSQASAMAEATVPVVPAAAAVAVATAETVETAALPPAVAAADTAETAETDKGIPAAAAADTAETAGMVVLMVPSMVPAVAAAADMGRMVLEEQAVATAETAETAELQPAAVAAATAETVETEETVLQ